MDKDSLRKVYPTSNESVNNIRRVCDKLASSLNSLPRVINQRSKDNYLDTLVKSHTVLYFCLNELGFMFQKAGNGQMSAGIWGIFKVYNLIFEKNNFFFQNQINNLYMANSRLGLVMEQEQDGEMGFIFRNRRKFKEEFGRFASD